MPGDYQQLIDKRRARRSFDAAAEHYDGVAVLQREIGNRMAERLDYIRLQPRAILDLGSGTGMHVDALLSRYRKARVYAMDFALSMLEKTRRKGSFFRRPGLVCADIDALPFADNSIDLVWSNAAIQWSSDPAALFTECRRILRPGGLLMFTTFGPDTLIELKRAWQAADSRVHVHSFADMHDLGDMMLSARLADPVLDVERMTLTYRHVNELMADLKALGAHNAQQGQSRGMTGKERYLRMRDSYETLRANGVLPASYEVVYGHAWAPEANRRIAEVAVELPRR